MVLLQLHLMLNLLVNLLYSNVNLKTWQVNEVRKNFTNIDDSDVFIEKPTQLSRELQCSHAYAPRGLRKIVYQNNSDGILYMEVEI